jgi:hypothetical protein
MSDSTQKTAKATLEDPTPSKFVQQAIIVAIVLIVLGLLVFIFASAITGGIIALLGVILGMGSSVHL